MDKQMERLQNIIKGCNVGRTMGWMDARKDRWELLWLGG